MGLSKLFRLDDWRALEVCSRMFNPRIHSSMVFCRLARLAMCVFVAGDVLAEEAVPRDVEITTVPGRLMFEQRKIQARPGELLRFNVKNTGALVHNFVICGEGIRSWKEVADLVIDLGEMSASQGFNPGPPLVTHATPLLGEGDSETLVWRAPMREGVYPFLSSVPGHTPLMRGEIVVGSAAGGLSNLQYHYYEGSWEKIPDFSKLKSIKSGKLPGGRIDFSAIPILSEREKREPGVMAGLVVTADARLLVAGSYALSLKSSATTNLSLSEVGNLNGNGETGAVHSEWFHDNDDGTVGLVLEVISDGSLTTPLAAWHGPRGTEVITTGDPGQLEWPFAYVVRPVEEEPVAVSVPMAGASELALAVGLPSTLNYCFDPATLNVRYFWMGEFLDARPVADDGSGRTGGNCRPLGAVHQLGAGLEFPLRIGDLAGEAPEVLYLGHTIGNAEEPELVFQVGDYTVAQRVSVGGGAVAGHPAVEFTFHIEPTPKVPVLFAADPSQVSVSAPEGFARGGVVVMAAGAEAFTVRLQPIPTKK